MKLNNIVCATAFATLALGACKPESTAATKAATKDHWVKTDTTSAMNDTPGVEYSVEAEEGNELGDAVTLTVGCKEGRSHVTVNPNLVNGGVKANSFGRDGRSGSQMIILRLDKQPPADVKLQVSDDLKTFGWGDKDAPTIARQLAKAQALVIRFDFISPGVTTTRELTFDISGLDAKLVEVAHTCKW